MPKPNSLGATLDNYGGPVRSSHFAGASAASAVSGEGKKSSRAGAVQIAAHFPEEVRAQLKVIAAEQRRDVQDLLAEG
jgi:hypothetical protein